MVENQMIYLMIIGLAGPIIIFLVTRRLKTVENQRKQTLRKRKSISSTTTETPLENPIKSIKAEGIESIETRFSIIGTIVITILGVLWIAILVIPFLNFIPATLVSVILGSSAVISGIAARPIIENFMAGVIITFNKPFRVGDTVIINEQYGTIEDITTTHTILKIWDWRRLVIPNSTMITKEFINYTINDSYIWQKVGFKVAYNTDLAYLKSLAIEIAVNSPNIVGDEPPMFWVMSLEDNHYKCWIAAWSDSPAKAWELGNDIRSALINAFQQHGIQTHGHIIVNESDFIKKTKNE
jgi:small-conductance mechanosensitive channel